MKLLWFLTPYITHQETSLRLKTISFLFNDFFYLSRSPSPSLRCVCKCSTLSMSKFEQGRDFKTLKLESVFLIRLNMESVHLYSPDATYTCCMERQASQQSEGLFWLDHMELTVNLESLGCRLFFNVVLILCFIVQLNQMQHFKVIRKIITLIVYFIFQVRA